MHLNGCLKISVMSLNHGLLYIITFSAGYGFLQPAQAEMFARQQEILRKQNLAR